jgi:tetratricopeptide (TPR) repeat protein
MRIGRMIIAAGLILLASTGSICSAEEAAVKVTPGYIDQDIKATEAKIATLHSRLDREQYTAIVDDASELMRKTLGRETMLSTLKKMRQDLGRLVAVKGKRFSHIMGAPVQVRAVYVAQYEKMDVTEFITFIKENGDFRLTQFQFMKGTTDLAFLEYRDWNDRASASYRRGDYEQAVEEFGKSLSIYPNVEAYIGRSAAYAARQEFAMAFADLDKAEGLKPAMAAVVNYHRGNVYFARKDYDGALAAFDKARALDPGIVPLYYAMAQALEEKGEHRSAIARYEEFLQRSYAAGTFNIYAVEDAKKRLTALRQKPD